MKLVFATNNQHKLEEVSAILGNSIELLSLKDINCDTDIPETADTLEGNALLKAQYIYNNFGINCFADDTGLEIEILNNEPGVYSARYAGENKNPEANMLKVLDNLREKENTKLENNANNLSGGQKQRIAIARTLIKQNKFIVFDDSLSKLDTRTKINILF